MLVLVNIELKMLIRELFFLHIQGGDKHYLREYAQKH